jgi:ribosomal protein S27AE
MKTCNKCNEEKDDDRFYKRGSGYRKECKDCHKARHYSYMQTELGKEAHSKANRKYYKMAPTKRYLINKEYRKRNPRKQRAHEVIAYQVRLGNIKKENCEKCSNEKVQAHHDDYSKPLNIRWLCSSCHCKHHMRFGEGLNP